MSPRTMRWASPSTIAVFPTPGSPMSTGLFFVRRDRTWTTRRISSSAADHRIQLVLAGIVGQIASVALECLVFPLGVLVGDPLGPADRGERVENPVPGDGVSFQKCRARKAITLVSERDEEVLRADVVVP